MEAITVLILALLGLAAGGNNLLQKEEHYLQEIEELPSNPREATVSITEAEETMDAQQPGPRSKTPFADNKMLELIFNNFGDKPEANKELAVRTRNAEIGDEDVSFDTVPSEEIDEDKVEVVTMTATDRFDAIDGTYCPNGTMVGDVCQTEDHDD